MEQKEIFWMVFSILFIENSFCEDCSRNFFASSIDLNLSSSSALKFSPDSDLKVPVVLKDDSGLKLLISFSLSTTNFTATD